MGSMVIITVLLMWASIQLHTYYSAKLPTEITIYLVSDYTSTDLITWHLLKLYVHIYTKSIEPHIRLEVQLR
jgi:hypothetical protein